MYVIWSQAYKKWYAPPRTGLTIHFENAYRYTLKEAQKHIREIEIERSNEGVKAKPEILLLVVEGEK